VRDQLGAKWSGLFDEFLLSGHGGVSPT